MPRVWGNKENLIPAMKEICFSEVNTRIWRSFPFWNDTSKYLLVASSGRTIVCYARESAFNAGIPIANGRKRPSLF